MSTETSPAPAKWRHLFSGGAGSVSVILAGGVALYAITVYLVGALMPAVARELDGEALYAWVNTAFLTTSITASASAGVLSRRLGLRVTYVIGFALFAGGALIVFLAPSMGVVIVGRAIQGLGGGSLAALAYVSINALLPQVLWGRAVALITAMWGIGGIVGPGIGGVFGEGSAWRVAFAGLALISLALGVFATFVIGGARTGDGESARFAFGSIVAVTAAVVAISLAAVVEGSTKWVLLGVGIVLLVVFAVIERAAEAPLLPRSTFRGTSALPWVYLLAGVLAGSVMIEAFLPLFGQQLGGFTPLAAGYLGAVPSIGWTIAQFLSAGVERDAVRRRLRWIGPVVVLVGFAVLAVVGGRIDELALAAWLVALLAIGAGIGLAFPHLVVAAMTSVDDPAEASQASAGISTVQLMSNALFSALCGLFLAVPSTALSGAQIMAAGLFAVVAVAVLISAMGLRRSARGARIPVR